MCSLALSSPSPEILSVLSFLMSLCLRMVADIVLHLRLNPWTFVLTISFKKKDVLVFWYVLALSKKGFSFQSL